MPKSTHTLSVTPSPFADLRALWATWRLIRRVRPDVVNASTPKAGLLGMVAAWMARVPVRVYVVRGFRFETATGWRRRLFRSLERLAAGCATHVVFNSASLLEVGRREGIVRGERGEVIGHGSGNGIDVERFADDALPDRDAARRELGVPLGDDVVVVGFVGRERDPERRDDRAGLVDDGHRERGVTEDSLFPLVECRHQRVTRSGYPRT